MSISKQSVESIRKILDDDANYQSDELKLGGIWYECMASGLSFEFDGGRVIIRTSYKAPISPEYKPISFSELERLQHQVKYSKSTGSQAAIIAPDVLEKLLGALRALESLTPGGSEFVGDPQACVNFIRSSRISTMNTLRRERIIKTLGEKR